MTQQGLAEDRVLDLRDRVDLLGVGVLDAVPLLEDGVRQHVDVLVDRAAEQISAVLAVVGGKVGAAAAERDAQGARLKMTLTRVLSPGRGRSQARSRTTEGCAMASRMFSVGAQPRELDLLGVEVDQRASRRPSHDRRRSSRARGVTPIWGGDRRDRVVDGDGLVGARGCRYRRRGRRRGGRRR